MDKVKPYVIGVDLGGTNTVFGVVNARGEVVGENSIKTQQYKTAEGRAYLKEQEGDTHHGGCGNCGGEK